MSEPEEPKTKIKLLAKTKIKTKKNSSLITWGPLAAIIVIIVIYVVTQLIAAFLINIYPALRHWNSTQASNWINNSVAAQFWVTVIIEALSLYFLSLFLKRRHSSFQSIGLKGRFVLADIGYTLSGFAVYFSTYYVVIILLTKAIPSFNVSQKQDLGFSSSTTGLGLWLIFISLVILPPIVEEILFRGFLYTSIKSKLPKIQAAIITSLIFASFHLLESTIGLIWVAGVDTFILSLVLVYLRERTDKLYASMGLHMLKNFLAFASLFLFHIS
jgi:membrane protease YdiL (CAAX protease family)